MVQYIPEICPHKDKCDECVTTNILSDVRYICAFPFREEQIEIIKKWNENIKKIPQKDEFLLEGIKHWYVCNFEMISDTSNWNIRDQGFRDDAAKLIAAGFDLGFCENHGVGHVCREDGGFVIELWQNHLKTEFRKETLDDVLDWIIYFHNKDQ